MNKKIKVYWMHCKSCEILLEKGLKEIEWVKVNEVNSKKWFLDIDLKNEADLSELESTIENLWYSLNEVEKKKTSLFDYIQLFLLFIIIGMIFFLLKDLNLFWNSLGKENGSFFIIFLIGITASMSSCLAVTGGIVIWFSNYLDSSKWFLSHLKIQWAFHIGRIIWFSILGWILGILGSFIGSIGILNKVLLFFVWFLMIYMGFNMLNIFPSITKFWVSMPKGFANKILNIKNPLFAPVVWALTFFLPCWFTQSMQVYATSSESFLSWAMIMWIFALWTAPILILVWIWSSYFKERKFVLLNKIIAIIVIYFWIFTLSWLSNYINIPKLNNTSPTQTNVNLVDLKKVSVEHDWNALVPSEIILEWAKSYELTINPSSDWLWCLYALTIPGIDEGEHLIKKWIPIVIHIKNIAPWSYNVVCTAMGMKHGTIIIK